MSALGSPVGTLMAVNVGMPKDVPWQGRTVFTGVFKDPVSGPCRVGRLNLEGDGQGDLAGLGGEEVCIGDRFRIGSAVFEATQPRVTCYRVGLRMNDPRIPALLVSHRRPGFYFRVLEEGEVQAGDEIRKVASGPEQMTVADVDALLYLPGHTR